MVRPTHEDPLVRSSSEVIGGPAGRRTSGHPWWTPVRVVLAVACVAWLLAIAQKAPCAADHWNGETSRYAQMCYSDVPYLYVARGFAEAALPYADSGGRYPDLEYPVLIGYFAHVTALVTQALNGGADLEARRAAPPDSLYADPQVEAERQDFFPVTAVLLAPFLLLSAWFLAGAHRGRPWDAMAFAAAPVLVLTGLVNWDVLAITCLAGAMWAWSRGRPVLSGVLVGLGTATKLYPVFLLGALLVVALRRREMSSFVKAAAAAMVAWLLVDLPAMLTNFDGWRGFWRFNSDRGADLGSLWLVATNAGGSFTPSTINRVSATVVVLVCVAVLVLGLVAPQVPRVPQLALLVLVGFLVVNKVYSPQYVLWLLPLAVLARPRWRDLLIWQAGEIFYFAMVWMYLGGFTAPSTSGATDAAYSWAIVVRVAAELYLVAVVVRDVLRPSRDPVRVSAGSPDHDPMWPEPGPVRAFS